jgi:transcriptional regulator with XRE-family HTH domain
MKPGPPRTSVPLDQVETLASIGCTLEEIASVVGLSKRSLIRRRDDPRFLEAIESGRAKGRASLRRLQWAAAKSGNITAQIWLGKQLLGQRSYEREEKRDTVEAPPLIIQTVSDEPETTPSAEKK